GANRGRQPCRMSPYRGFLSVRRSICSGPSQVASFGQRSIPECDTVVRSGHEDLPHLQRGLALVEPVARSPPAAEWSLGGFTRLAYRPSSQTARWKRGMICHCMNDPQPEGSHGKLHRTTKILSHARRRGVVAARGARAAAGDAGDRLPQHPIARRVRGAAAWVAKGYVANLSRPGGNVTGIFVRQLELAAKRVEI